MSKVISGLILLLLMISALAVIFEIQPVKAVGNEALTLIPVPFHYQVRDYYCGPAALEIVFDYYGEDVSQYAIAHAARTLGSPWYSTWTDDLRRAAQFSNISTSMSGELPGNITGYTVRELGYSASEAEGLDLTTLRSFLDQGKPLILLMWQDSSHTYGHFRVATGYNETYVFLDDPWNVLQWGGTYGGPNVALDNTQFLDLWSYSGDWALYVSPWTLNFSAPTHVKFGVPFQVEATVTYPQPLPNSLSLYEASSCNATIALPANLSLAEGEAQTKALDTGILQAGGSCSTSWTLIANSYVTGAIEITAEGLISGSVSAEPGYPAYDYNDRIGVCVNSPVEIEELHKITVQNVVPFKNVVGQGYGVGMNITLINNVEYAETFNVTVYSTCSMNQTAIGTVENITLAASTSSSVTFAWNATGFACGNYTISVCTSTATGEINTFTYTCGQTMVTIPGDVGGDFKVTTLDLTLLANAYGSRQGSPRWNANADIDNNGVVGLLDLTILAVHYGQHYP